MDRPSHEHPSGDVNKRQATLLGRLTQEGHDLGHAFVARAPVAALRVHVGRAGRAFAVGRSDDVKRPAGEQGFEFRAGAAGWQRRLWLRGNESRLRMPRIRRVLNVDLPLVAVLRDDTGHDFVKRVTALAAACFKVRAATGYHGREFREQVIVPPDPE